MKERFKTRNQKRILFVSLLMFTLAILYGLPSHIVRAQENISMYENPEDIIITAPKDNFSTKSSQVSILGACDYRYPLYMNGELIETTSLGFFTVYVDLEVGQNQFIFENDENVKFLTITRTKSSTKPGSTSSNTGTTPKVTYKAYTTNTYGVVKSNYTMPRSKINAADIELMPLTKGTTFRILGEDGSYYKIVDGTYVSKASVTKYNKALTSNKVTKAVVSDNKNTNTLVTKLTMNVNSMYSVSISNNSVFLTLYDTVSVRKATLAANDTVKSVTVSVDKNKKTATYQYDLYEDAIICGYDIDFRDGAMIFELKKAPHLKEIGSLNGAVIYLDAGHGANDTGALGPLSTLGPTEKDFNLAITLYAKEYLESLGAKVVLTRTEDTFLSLSDRVAAIRSLKPDISISIHGNSLDVTSDYSKASGFLTYYSYNLLQNVPATINESIGKQLEFNVRDPRRSSLSLTRLTACPAILLETKFLSNPADYEYLLSDTNQQKFGEAIGTAIQEYLEKIAVYEEKQVIHTVQKGETISSIARKYGVSIQNITEWNKIENMNYITVGQKLIIRL